VRAGRCCTHQKRHVITNVTSPEWCRSKVHEGVELRVWTLMLLLLSTVVEPRAAQVTVAATLASRVATAIAARPWSGRQHAGQPGIRHLHGCRGLAVVEPGFVSMAASLTCFLYSFDYRSRTLSSTIRTLAGEQRCLLGDCAKRAHFLFTNQLVGAWRPSSAGPAALDHFLTFALMGKFTSVRLT
jgi:hypothetical protein